MKLLANENIPWASVLVLRQLGYDVVAIGSDFQGISDNSVMQIAIKQERLIITFDRDYGTLIFKQDLKPPKGVIYLRLDAYTPEAPGYMVHQLLSFSQLETAGCLTVYDGESIRQRKYL